MDHNFQTVNLHRFVEGAFLRDIFHNTEIQLGRWRVRMRIFDLLGFFFGADGRDDGMAAFEKNIENVRCDEAATTCVVVRFSVRGGVPRGIRCLGTCQQYASHFGCVWVVILTET
jgi:hypothetical protein